MTMLSKRDLVLGAALGIGAAAVTLSEATGQTSAASLTIVYPNHDGAKFDTAYYRSKHIPLAMQVMKAASVTVIEGTPNGATPPPYRMIAHFLFTSPEARQAALANPRMAEVRADIPTFTDIKQVVMLGRSE